MVRCSCGNLLKQFVSLQRNVQVLVYSVTHTSVSVGRCSCGKSTSSFEAICQFTKECAGSGIFSHAYVSFCREVQLW